VKEFGQMVLTFGLTCLAWIFFRAENVGHAWSYISEIFSQSIIEIPRFPGMKKALTTIMLVTFFMAVEWHGREHQFAIQRSFSQKNRIVRWSFYAFIVFLIGMFMPTEETPFIYFQF
jgi:D-alanyl-lipoteichoic acid acyltransferase DltB (MBOAT superfamily)